MSEQLTALKEMDRFFEAYVNHRSDVIFLKGLPDILESRPHSRGNSQ